MTDKPNIYDRGDLAKAAAAAIAIILREALQIRGQASLMVSGGSSPKPLFEILSKADLDWSKVTISLVDERWVESGEAGSNEDFIRQALLQNKAKAAQFFGLKTPFKTVKSGLKASETRFEKLPKPFDVCIMGMGSDAHSASWFPNATGLSEALSLKNKNVLCALDASGAPVAGNHPHRISLTLRAVLDSHTIFLFIPGKAKRVVFNDAPNKPLSDAPVQALLRAGSKLHVFASPTP